MFSDGLCPAREFGHQLPCYRPEALAPSIACPGRGEDVSQRLGPAEYGSPPPSMGGSPANWDSGEIVRL